MRKGKKQTKGKVKNNIPWIRLFILIGLVFGVTLAIELKYNLDNYYSEQKVDMFGITGYVIGELTGYSSQERDVSINEEGYTNQDISDCGSLNSIGLTKYVLINNIDRNDLTDSCFKVEQPDAIIDCNGYHIYTANNVNAIYSNQINTKIINCEISTGAGLGGNAISLNGADNTIIKNVNLISQNKGINVLESDNVNIINSKIRNSNEAVVIDQSSNAFLKNNTLELNTNALGIWIGTGNFIVNNTIKQSTKSIYLWQGRNNNFVNLSIDNSAEDAIYFDTESGDNSFENVKITNTNPAYYDIRFASTGMNNTKFIDTAINNYYFTGLGGTATFKKNGKAEIKILERINGTGSHLFDSDLSSIIKIDSNYVYVGAVDEINKPANITLYNINLTSLRIRDPEPYRDGIKCSISGKCSAMTNNSMTYYFSVSSFSNYTINGIETIPPVINWVNVKNPVGFGVNISIKVNVTDPSNISLVRLMLNDTLGNIKYYNVANISKEVFLFNDYRNYTNGTYHYMVFANDSFGNKVNTSGLFYMQMDLAMNIFTVHDLYYSNEIVNLTDPPMGGIDVKIQDMTIGDGDGIGIGDNCPSYYNPSQLDYDSNGIGNACEIIHGDGTTVSPYEIRNCKQLDNIRYIITSRPNNALNFVLVNDINCSGYKSVGTTNGFIPLPELNGVSTFDGRGNRIYSLYYNNAGVSNIGFFSRNGGTIKNIIFINLYMHGSTPVGGIAATNYGTIKNIAINSGAVTGRACIVGGIVGINEAGVINNSYFLGSVAEQYKSTSPYYCGDGSTGGIVGSMTGGTLVNVYSNATFTVWGSTGVGITGGLVARGGSSISSFWNNEESKSGVIPVTYSSTGTGLTSTEMALQSTFIGWDFNNVWIMGTKKPYLRIEKLGDSIQDNNEQCDDGNRNNCDGCSSNGILETDLDNDGIYDTCDNCISVSNSNQADTDESSVGDICNNALDLDNNELDLFDNSDGDALLDYKDNCPTVSNPTQTDGDNDGVGDACDNCPIDYNYNQADYDNDGIGDVCDAFDSGDGTINNPYIISNCPAINYINRYTRNYFALGADIDCNGYTLSTIQFNSGGLDGRGHSISNINKVDSIFTNINGVNISNISFRNITINCVSSTCAILGKQIQHYYNNGNYEYPNFNDIYVSGKINALFSGYYSIGGLGAYTYHLNLNHFIVNVTINYNSPSSVTIGGLLGKSDDSVKVTNGYVLGSINLISLSACDVGGAFGASIGNVDIRNIAVLNDVNCNGNSGRCAAVSAAPYNWGTGPVLTNVWWNDQPNNPNVCRTDGSSESTCNKINNNLAYFYGVTNPPMSSWDFVHHWKNMGVNEFPKLLVQGPFAECGNNAVEGNELCDGNSQSCTTNGGYAGSQTCNGQCDGWNSCLSSENCGDNIVNGNEECDGNSRSCLTVEGYNGAQRCNDQCDGWHQCSSEEYCGDGILEGTEACDDGNTQNNDGCSKNCIKEPIPKYIKYSGVCDTTNLSKMDLSTDTSVSNLVIDDCKRKITFNDNVILNQDYDLDKAIVMSYSENKATIFVNSTLYPSLNKPATLMVRELPFRDVVVYKNGVPCSDCNVQSYDSETGNLVLDITGFSEITILEGNQSFVRNSGPTNVSARLLLKVQYHNLTTNTWERDVIVYNGSVPLLQNDGTKLKLDQYFNNKFNTSMNASISGYYRVTSDLLDPNGITLENYDGIVAHKEHGFVIQLTPPTITELYINATAKTNYTDENLSCYARPYDGEQKHVSVYYTWYKNSVVYSSGYIPSIDNGSLTFISKITASETQTGDEWNCSVKLADELTNGTTYSNKIRVRNPDAVGNCFIINQDTVHYNLTSNIVDYSMIDHCIKITANDAIFDCGGHYIQSDDPYAGIYVTSNNVTIRNCNITMSNGIGGKGIWVYNAHDIKIENSTFNNQYIGVEIDHSEGTEIIDSNSKNNAVGISLDYSQRSRIINSNISSSSNEGIEMWFSSGNTIENSAIGSSAKTGVYFYESSNNNLIGTSIDNSGQDAIYMDIDSMNNIFMNINTKNYGVGYNALKVAASGDDNTYLIDSNISQFDIVSPGSIFIIEETGKGKVVFTRPIYGSGNHLNDKIAGEVISFNNNLINVDSNNYKGFNKSADLTFYNINTAGLGITDPSPYVNGVQCNISRFCTDVTNISKTFYFSVNHFTEYSIGEDRIPPVIKIIDPISWSIKSWDVDLVANATDDTLRKVWYKIYNKAGTLVETDYLNHLIGNSYEKIFATSESYPYDAFLLDHYNLTLVIYANDSAGNKANKTLNFTLDNSNPTFIENRLPFFTNKDFNLNTLVKDYKLSSVKYRVYNNSLEIQSGELFISNNNYLVNFAIDVDSLADGNYTLEIYSNDSVSNEDRYYNWFYVDRTKPYLNVSSPNKVWYNESIIIVNYTSKDLAGIDYVWYKDGTNSLRDSFDVIGLPSRYMYEGIEFLVDGWHNFTFYANDSASNWNSTFVKVAIDTTDPEWELYYHDSYDDIDTIEYGFENLNVTWNSSDEMKWNKTLFNITFYDYDLYEERVIYQSTNQNGNVVINLTNTLYNLGTYYANIYTKDYVGWENSGDIVFDVVDTTDPVAKLNINSTTVEYGRDYVYLNWTVSDYLFSDLDLDYEDPDSNYKFIISYWLFPKGNLTLGPKNLTKLGYYDFYVWAFDTSNNYDGSWKYFRVVDTTKPNVTIMKNNTNDHLEMGVDSIKINGTFFDLLPDVLKANCTMPDNSLLANWDDNFSAVFTPTQLNQEGEYICKIYMGDTSGNFRGKNITFFVNDTIAPKINIIAPLRNEILGWTINLNSNIIEIGSGLRDGQLKIYNKNNIEVYGEDVTSLNIDTNWVSDGSTPYGNYTLVISACDKSDNCNSSNVTFIVDNNKPGVQFIVAYNQFRNSNFSMDLRMTNEHMRNFSYVITNSLGVIVHSNYSLVPLPGIKSFNYDHEVNVDHLSDGNYTIIGFAKDVTGNYRNATTWFYVDKTKPVTTLVKNNSLDLEYGYEAVIVNGTFFDKFENHKEASCINPAGDIVYTASSNFSKKFSIYNGVDRLGIYNCTINMTDLAGNKDGNALNFKFKDTTKPNITLVKNTSQFLEFGRDSIMINGSFWDYFPYINYSGCYKDLPVRIFMDSWTGNFSKVYTPLELNEIGTYYCDFYAKDTSGNDRYKMISFDVNDTTNPKVTLTINSTAVEYGRDSVKINGTFFDLLPEYRYAECTDPYGAIINNWNNNFSIILSPAELHFIGKYNCSIYMNDTSKNSNYTSVAFNVVDTTKPIVKVTTSRSVAEALVDNVKINVSFFDLLPDKRYSECRYPNNTVFIVSYSSFNVSLFNELNRVGKYNCSAWMNDTSNNKKFNSTTFIVQDTILPVVRVNSPTSKYYGVKNILINFSATDNTLRSLKFNNGTHNITHTGLGTMTLIDGKKNFTFYAIDDANNVGKINVNFTIDTTGPSVKLVNPLNKSLITTADVISFKYNVTDALSQIKNCSLIINNINVQTNTNITLINNSFGRSLTDGTYNWKVECFDAVGNNKSSDINTLSVSIPRSSGGGSTSGSSGSGRVISNITTEIVFEGNNAVINAIAKYVYYFTYNGEKHHIKIDEVGKDSVTFTVRSIPMTVTLNKGEITTFDLDSDSQSDLSVKYIGSEKGVPNLLLTLIEKVGPKARVEIVPTEAPEVATPTVEPTEEPIATLQLPKITEKSVTLFVIFSLLSLVFILGVYELFIIRKHHQVHNVGEVFESEKSIPIEVKNIPVVKEEPKINFPELEKEAKMIELQKPSIVSKIKENIPFLISNDEKLEKINAEIKELDMINKESENINKNLKIKKVLKKRNMKKSK